METTNIDQISEFQNLDIDEDGFVLVSEGEIKSVNMLNILSEELSENYDDKSIENQILKIEKDFKHWTELRRITISNLRDIADYIGKLVYSLAVSVPLNTYVVAIFTVLVTFFHGLHRIGDKENRNSESDWIRWRSNWWWPNNAWRNSNYCNGWRCLASFNRGN